MAQSGFSEIISQLEGQKRAIDKALEALRELDGVDGNGPASSSRNRPLPDQHLAKAVMTPEGRSGYRRH